MKKITLLFLCLCVSVLSHAGTNKGDLNSLKLKNEKLQTISKIEKLTSPTTSLDAHKQRIEALREKSEKREEENNQIRNQKRGRSGELKALLDSVVYVKPDGTNFTKEVYTYDEDYYDTSYTSYIWNEDINDWQMYEKNTYEWDDQKRPVAVEGALYFEYGTEGLRYEYAYNSKGELSEEVVIAIIGDEQMFLEKKEYAYDEAGNLIEMISYAYDAEWQKQTKAVYEYDSKGRLILVEEYSWLDSWKGVGKNVAAFDEDGNQTLFHSFVWSYNDSKWVNELKIVQVFEKGNIVEQGEYFWNEEEQAWSGKYDWGEFIPNKKTIFSYNEDGLQISEVFSTCLDGEWIVSVDMEITYTPIENGLTRYERKTYFHENGEREHWKTLIVDYYMSETPVPDDYGFDKLPKNNVKLYVYESDEWIGGPIYEEFYEFYETGKIKDEIYYEYVDGVKTANIWVSYKYDENGNVLRFLTSSRDENEDAAPTDWVESSKFEYVYKNNVRTRNQRYINLGDGNWTPDWGTGADFDFALTLDELVVNIGYAFGCKADYYYDYAGNGSDWDTSTRTYYWYHFDGNGLGEVVESPMTVYPNPTSDLIRINSSEAVMVTIYNVNGSRLLQTMEKEINLSAFAPGVYIVDVNGVKTKVIKK